MVQFTQDSFTVDPGSFTLTPTMTWMTGHSFTMNEESNMIRWGEIIMAASSLLIQVAALSGRSGEFTHLSHVTGHVTDDFNSVAQVSVNEQSPSSQSDCSIVLQAE